MNTKFQSFVCPGDSIQWSAYGFDLTATVYADSDSRPEDSDCYTPEQIKAWRAEEWFFCGIVVSVSRAGITLSDRSVSLWGIEANFPGTDNSYLSEVADELQAEALSYARKNLAILIEASKIEGDI